MRAIGRPWGVMMTSRREAGGGHHMRACAGVMDQPGAAPVSAIDQPPSPLSAVSGSGDERCNAPAVVAQTMATTIRILKAAFFMERPCATYPRAQIARGWDGAL